MPKAATKIEGSQSGAGKMAPAPKEPDKKRYSGRLAARIRFLREEAGLTVEELAEKITDAGHSIATPSLYHWENGNRVPSIDALPAIAKALKLKSVSELLPPK